jgi:hypothetical protein
MIENNNYCTNKSKKGSTRCKCHTGKTSPPHDHDDQNSSPDPPVEESDLHRVLSLTGNEKYALGSLLIDLSEDQSRNMLTHEMLFSTPYPKVKDLQLTDTDTTTAAFGDKATACQSMQGENPRRNSKRHSSLWKAHEVGFIHSFHKKQGATKTNSPAVVRPSLAKKKQTKSQSGQPSDYNINENQGNNQSIASSSGFETDAAKTDMSQCGEGTEGSSFGSSSSWDEDAPDHFDAWQVLADEYAEDFGFDYKPDSSENVNVDEERRSFQILGTSSGDLKAQPHVLSPPLMESLLSFVPESLSCENWWLKYSLVRDGASLDTLRNYCRAAQYTVLAIQTTKGDVFGAFTTAPWHTGEHGYFGCGESFVWKMRHNRFDHCCSLYEQAQMESECDVYPYSGLNNCIQLCTQDFLGVGGGEIDHQLPFDDIAAEVIGRQKSLGFAIALRDDLSRGTSCPSSTFCNKKLSSNDDGGIFDVCNLEVWTFTPCTNVEDAEKLEMRKHFLRERMHQQSMASISSTSLGSSVPSSPMASQRLFYRRVGESDENMWAHGQGESSSSMKTPT